MGVVVVAHIDSVVHNNKHNNPGWFFLKQLHGLRKFWQRYFRRLMSGSRRTATLNSWVSHTSLDFLGLFAVLTRILPACLWGRRIVQLDYSNRRIVFLLSSLIVWLVFLNLRKREDSRLNRICVLAASLYACLPPRLARLRACQDNADRRYGERGNIPGVKWYRCLAPNNALSRKGCVLDVVFLRLTTKPGLRSCFVCFQITGEVGSFRYMAPEVVRHQPYNAKADIYSWAILTWEMMSIEKPYAWATKESSFIKVIFRRGGRAPLKHTHTAVQQYRCMKFQQIRNLRL